MSTSYTIENLTAIELAISSGTLTVKYGEDTVTYRSLDELLRIRDIIATALKPPSQRKNPNKFASYGSGIR